MHEKDSEDHEVHVSVKKSHDIYELTAEVFTPEHVAVHSKERDLKKAVDMAKDQMLRRLRKNKDKRITLKRNRWSYISGSSRYIDNISGM